MLRFGIRAHRAHLALLVALGLSSAPASARADDGMGGAIVFAYTLGTLDFLSLVGGIVAVAGNAVVIADDARSSDAWPITGFVFGGLNLAAGLVAGGYGIAGDTAALLGFGIGQLALGSVALGLGVRALDAPIGGGEVSVVPFLMPDGQGGLAAGLSLSVAEF